MERAFYHGAPHLRMAYDRPMARIATAHTVLLMAGLALWPGCSCGNGQAGPDGGPGDGGAATSDGGSSADAAAPLIWVDFSVSGCTGDADAPADPDAGVADEPCVGAAPMALSFAPLAPARIDVYNWNFGDGQSSSDASPVHVYAAPGVYDVSLSAQGPGGTAVVNKTGLVVVGLSVLAGPCGGDEDCQSGTCLCDDELCPGLDDGLCTASCAVDPCDSGVCVELAAGNPADPAPWQEHLCLPECTSDDSCPVGRACRELLAADGSGWVKACFSPQLLGAIGDSCADEDGILQDSACASGLCLSEGARGLCSADCSSQACPDSAACATFEGSPADPVCLARCDEDTSCDSDPYLACELAGGAGDKDFTVDETASGDGYCAPKSCSMPSDCGQDGQCVSGFCAP